MASLREVTALQELSKLLLDIDKGITSVDEKIIKLDKDLVKLGKTTRENSSSFRGLTEAQQKAKETSEGVDRIGKQLLTTEQKLKDFGDKSVRLVMDGIP